MSLICRKTWRFCLSVAWTNPLDDQIKTWTKWGFSKPVCSTDNLRWRSISGVSGNFNEVASNRTVGETNRPDIRKHVASNRSSCPDRIEVRENSDVDNSESINVRFVWSLDCIEMASVEDKCGNENFVRLDWASDSASGLLMPSNIRKERSKFMWICLGQSLLRVIE